jgi:hypothetical protein
MVCAAFFAPGFARNENLRHGDYYGRAGALLGKMIAPGKNSSGWSESGVVEKCYTICDCRGPGSDYIEIFGTFEKGMFFAH